MKSSIQLSTKTKKKLYAVMGIPMIKSKPIKGRGTSKLLYKQYGAGGRYGNIFNSSFPDISIIDTVKLSNRYLQKIKGYSKRKLNKHIALLNKKGMLGIDSVVPTILNLAIGFKNRNVSIKVTTIKQELKDREVQSCNMH